MEPVDVSKLKKAVLHSSVVVSVFAKTENEWYNRMVPLNALSGELVGFGRAVCDGALTASIYDVMVCWFWFLCVFVWFKDEFD